MLGATDTTSGPDVAPTGTVKTIEVLLHKLIVIEAPFSNKTLPFCVAPKLLPVISTWLPTEADVADKPVIENVDKVIEKATKLGATPQGPVMDMFWGDRCGTVVDPDGYSWMIGTHKAEPSAKEMKKAMEEMMKQQPAGAAAAD